LIRAVASVPKASGKSYCINMRLNDIGTINIRSFVWINNPGVPQAQGETLTRTMEGL
jgi:hypothetical protein